MGAELDASWAGEASGNVVRSADSGAPRPIGEVAREFGISLRALRFYEAKGLLNPVRRGATRMYDAAECERLAMLLKARQLGFTLSEIRQMLEADSSGELSLSRRQCHEQIKHLEQRQREIEAALTELRRTYSLFYVRIGQRAP